MQITEDQAAQTLSLDDAYAWMESLWTWRRDAVDHVHADWSELPWYLSQDWAEYDNVTRASTLSWVPAGFLGNLVAQAPLVAHSTAQQGPASETWTTTYAVTVTQTTTEGYEYGLSVDAGIGEEGSEIKAGGNLKWTKSTTDSSSVTKSDQYSKTVPIDDGWWGRQDVRGCAGVYTGWLIYRWERDDSQELADRLAVYPMRLPVHVPGVVDPVATHNMTCPTSKLSSEENRLLAEQAQLHKELTAPDRRETDPRESARKLKRLKEIRSRLKSVES